MERSCRRRCRRADNYDSGGKTLVVVIVGSYLEFEIDSRCQHFSFSSWVGRACTRRFFQHIPGVNHALGGEMRCENLGLSFLLLEVLHLSARILIDEISTSCDQSGCCV